ncbi:cytochrome P450 89A2-like [Pistacia vera]|uniref:cytochrome P450 89A2-like n=1 Tax=Pistacia vera TaxID=55513 RepID=UPI001262BA56|nr:cytochrome P450 89A2-like [Pistacia vera]
MDLQTCIVILISLCVCLLISFIFSRFFSSKTRNTRKLPPGPPTLHLIANFLWHRKPFFELGKIVSDLRKRYGPIITIKIGSEPTIFITNNTLAYQALVLNGAIFADRPKTTFADRLFPNKRKGVSLFPYGATWRSLRRNLTGTSGVLHPSRLISCSHIRKRVLDNLIHRLKQDSEHEGGIHVVDRFTYTIFSLLVLMCFGDNLDENTIRELECSQNKFFTCFPKVKVFLIMPNLGKILFRNRWNEFVNMLKDREDMFLSLIRAREKMKQGENKGENIDQFVSYVDTLLELQVPGENKKFEEGDIVSLSDEFISAGTDTTTTALQWIMANVVKYPRIQEKISLSYFFGF